MQFYVPIYPIAVVLVLSRFAALVGMTAVFGRRQIPVRIRLMIAVALTWFAVANLPPEWNVYCQSLNKLSVLVMAIIGEMLMGAALGLVCDLFIGVLSMAGLIVGQGSSLSMAQMMDPATGESDVIVSTIFTMLFTLLVLLWDGHLFLIKIMMKSFHVLPPGFSWFREELLEMYTVLGSDLFAWGIRYALPTLVGGLLVVVAMGLMAKMAPEFNVLFLSLPVRLVMGLGMLVIFFLYGYGPFYRVFEGMLVHMRYILAGGG
jgi:flagellar biosynthesis protein FliR